APADLLGRTADVVDLAAEVHGHVLAPLLGALLVNADQVAVAGEREDQIAADGRGCVRSSVPAIALPVEHLPELCRPGALAGLDVHGVNVLFLVPGAEVVECVADNRGC